MSFLDNNLNILYSKLNRILHYIEKFECDSLVVESENEKAHNLLIELLSMLRCEGTTPSHQDIFFLHRLSNCDVKKHNLAFLQEHLGFQLDKLYYEIDQLLTINSKCNGGVDLDGTT